MGKRMGQGVAERACQRGLGPAFAVGLLLTLPMCGGSAVPSTGANAGSGGDAGMNAAAGSGYAGASAGAAGMNALAGGSDEGGAAGADAAGACAALAICGGDPTGHWQANAEAGASSGLVGACLRPVYPPFQPSQCAELEFAPGDSGIPVITRVALPLPTDFVVSSADLSLAVDHSYSFSTSLSGDSAMHFAPICLLPDGPGPVCATLTAQLLEATRTDPGFGLLECASAPDAGCDCYWKHLIYTEDRGTWQVTGTVLSFQSSLDSGDAGPTPVAYNFCEVADTLAVSLHPGASSLRGAALGLGTLLLRRTQ